MSWLKFFHPSFELKSLPNLLINDKTKWILNLHSGRGQVGVLIFQSSIQSQPPLLLVFSKPGSDGQSVLIVAIWLHCLSVDKITQTKHLNIALCFHRVINMFVVQCFQYNANVPKLLEENLLGVFVCWVEDNICGLVHCWRRKVNEEIVRKGFLDECFFKVKIQFKGMLKFNERNAPVILNFLTVLLLSLLILILIWIASPW